VEILSKINRARRELTRDLGREPSAAELAKEVDLPAEKVVEIQRSARQPVSLDHPVGQDGDARLADFIEDAEALVVADAVALAMLRRSAHVNDLRELLG